LIYCSTVENRKIKVSKIDVTRVNVQLETKRTLVYDKFCIIFVVGKYYSYYIILVFY
jgi:hypothetical protein